MVEDLIERLAKKAYLRDWVALLGAKWEDISTTAKYKYRNTARLHVYGVLSELKQLCENSENIQLKPEVQNWIEKYSDL